MQTPNYQRNSHKAVAAERAKDYPMAVVYWTNAKKSAINTRDTSWAHCQIVKCKRHVKHLRGQDA